MLWLKPSQADDYLISHLIMHMEIRQCREAFHFQYLRVTFISGNSPMMNWGEHSKDFISTAYRDGRQLGLTNGQYDRREDQQSWTLLSSILQTAAYVNVLLWISIGGLNLRPSGLTPMAHISLSTQRMASCCMVTHGL
jgi:hypothetical protein